MIELPARVLSRIVPSASVVLPVSPMSCGAFAVFFQVLATGSYISAVGQSAVVQAGPSMYSPPPTKKRPSLRTCCCAPPRACALLATAFQVPVA